MVWLHACPPSFLTWFPSSLTWGGDHSQLRQSGAAFLSLSACPGLQHLLSIPDAWPKPSDVLVPWLGHPEWGETLFRPRSVSGWVLRRGSKPHRLWVSGSEVYGLVSSGLHCMFSVSSLGALLSRRCPVHVRLSSFLPVADIIMSTNCIENHSWEYFRVDLL